jgi:tetratricopeptide (TPR) repeat protein
LKKKDKEAYSHLSRYLEYHPEDTVTMQILAEGLNRLELYEEAIELSERVRIREPKNISNLITLIESYAKISKLDRVDSLIKNIYRLDPKNQFVKKYKR